MGDDGISRKIIPENCSESDEPFLSASVSLLEGRGVLPVDVHSVQMVVLDEFGQFETAVSGIISRRCGIFSRSEGAHQQLDSSFGIVGLEGELDLLSGVSEHSCTDVVKRIRPDCGCVDWPRSVSPEGEGDVVEGEGDSSLCVSGHGESFCDGRGWPPLCELVDVGELENVLVGDDEHEFEFVVELVLE